MLPVVLPKKFSTKKYVEMKPRVNLLTKWCKKKAHFFFPTQVRVNFFASHTNASNRVEISVGSVVHFNRFMEKLEFSQKMHRN